MDLNSVLISNNIYKTIKFLGSEMVLHYARIMNDYQNQFNQMKSFTVTVENLNIIENEFQYTIDNFKLSFIQFLKEKIGVKTEITRIKEYEDKVANFDLKIFS